MRHDLTFTFDGQLVGYFDEPQCPRSPGRYRYVPCRGVGHYELGVRLGKGEHPRCTMARHPDVSFTVMACPEYGLLELSEFAPGDRP